MSFVLSSVLSFLIFQFLSFASIVPSQFGTTYRLFGITFWIEPDRGKSIATFIKVAISTGGIAALIEIHNIIPAVYDLIYPYRTGVLLGAGFGPLFAIWINRIVRKPPGDDLDRWETVALFAMAILAIVGIFGDSGVAALTRYAHSLQKASYGSLAFEFNVTAKTAANDPDKVVAPPATARNSASSIHSVGLYDFGNLPNIIDQDCQIIAFGKAYIESHRAGKTVSFEKKRCDDGKLNAEGTFFAETLSDQTACLFAISQVTADSLTAQARLQKFVPMYQAFMSGWFDRTTYAMRLATDISEAAFDTKRWTDLALQHVQSDGRYDEADSAAVVRECRNFRSIFCSDGDEIDRPLCTAKSYSSHLLNLLGPFVQTLADGKAALTPYLSLAHADLMVYFDNYSAAVQRLDEWIKAHDPGDASFDPFSRLGDEVDRFQSQYFVLRARIALAFFAEGWLLRDDLGAPFYLRKLHMDNLRALIDLFDQISPVHAVIAESQKHLSNIESTGFTIPIHSTNDCILTNKPLALLIQKYYNTKLLYSHNYLLLDGTKIKESKEEHHTDDDRLIDEYLKEVINADLGCLDHNLDVDASAGLLGDAIALYVKKRVNDAGKASLSDAPSGKADAEAQLKLARSALEIGFYKIQNARNKEKKAQQTSKSFVATASLSPALDTYETLVDMDRLVEQTAASLKSKD